MCAYRITKTGDGTLTSLGQLNERIIQGDGTEFKVGVAQAVITWGEKDLGDKSLDQDMLKDNLTRIDEVKQYVNLMIRSFLARIGLNGRINDFRFTPEGFELQAHADLEFFSSRDNDTGTIEYPLYDAFARLLEQGDVRPKVAELFTLPPNVEPYCGEQLDEMIGHGRLHVSDQLEYDADGNLEIPLELDAWFRRNLANALIDNDWPWLLADGGKRFLARFQPPQRGKRNGHSNLLPPFDIRGFRWDASLEDILILSEDTTHDDVKHSNSLWISTGLGQRDAGTSQLRHAELNTGKSDVSQEEVRLNGKLFPLTPESERTSVSVPRTVIERSGEQFYSRRKDEIIRLTAELDDVDGAEGLIVGADGVILIPSDSPEELWADARYAAVHGRASCGDLQGQLADAQERFEADPAVQALQSLIQRNAGSHHTLKYALVCKTSPNPHEIRQLAGETGIWTYISSRLRTGNGVADEVSDHHETSIETGWMEALSDMVRKGESQILWSAPGGRLRALQGVSFIDIDRLEQFRNLSSVDSFFCSFTQQSTDLLREQLPPYIEARLQDDPNYGIASGASSGWMTILSEIVQKYPQVQLIGAANVLPNQTPNDSAHAFALFDGRHRRHRQTNLAYWGDRFITVNGGRGTMGETTEELVDMTTRFTVPCPVPLTDLLPTAKDDHYWHHLVEQYRRCEKDGFADECILKLMVPTCSLMETRDAFEKFRRDPVEWWQERNIPQHFITGGLKTHAYNAKLTGRKVAKDLRPGYEHYDIDPDKILVV